MSFIFRSAADMSMLKTTCPVYAAKALIACCAHFVAISRYVFEATCCQSCLDNLQPRKRQCTRGNGTT
eukprot:12916728-Prorocentrum_lima.AAC.1